jgi:hypothetical protein
MLQSAQRPRDPSAGVGGQTVSSDQAIEVFDSRDRELDTGHVHVIGFSAARDGLAHWCTRLRTASRFAAISVRGSDM